MDDNERLKVFLMGFVLLLAGLFVTYAVIRLTLADLAQYHIIGTDWLLTLLFGTLEVGLFLSGAVLGAWMLITSVRGHE